MRSCGAQTACAVSVAHRRVAGISPATFGASVSPYASTLPSRHLQSRCHAAACCTLNMLLVGTRPCTKPRIYCIAPAFMLGSASSAVTCCSLVRNSQPVLVPSTSSQASLSFARTLVPAPTLTLLVMRHPPGPQLPCSDGPPHQAKA